MRNPVWILSCPLLALGLAAPVQAEPAGKAAGPVPAEKRWAADGPGGVPDFAHHVQPLLGKLGCSNRACHGSFQGQGGFQLSLFGSDPKMDQEGLKARVNVRDPEESLALLKATKQTSHKGGQRFEVGGWQYRLFKEWIAAGAPFAPGKEAAVARLEVVPAQAVLSKRGEKVQIKVVAHYTDRTTEDVTALTQFSSNDEVIAGVSQSGLVTAGGCGDTAVVATFGGAVSTAHVLVPLPGAGSQPSAFPANNKIDELAAAKWRKLGIRPSELAGDAEFLRRVSLDLIGTLPAANEVRRFLADKDPAKRSRKIDELLGRPEYALFWAVKFCDLTGNDDRLLPNPRPKPAWLWYDWIKVRLEKNVPYDELVAGFVTATSREGRSAKEYLEEHQQVSQAIANGFGEGTYARRKTNDLFWKSNNGRGRKPEDVALRVSYAFLGVRLECAQCHKHPFDRWTQDDFKGYTAFFTAVRAGVPADVVLPEGMTRAGPGIGNLYEQYFEIFLAPAAAAKGGDKESVRPRVPGGPERPLPEGADPRAVLMEWMRAPDNPYFARAIVNRLWAHYFGVGIVEPPDDLNAANPPSNPALMDWLAKDFIAHQFDLKHLHRTILNSRTYQLTWKTNETNALDERNFARALLRQMPAEVVVDAINQVTGGEERYPPEFAPRGTRAIGLAPARVDKTRPGYALGIFGRPIRTQTCDCERSLDTALPQAMYLINDADVNAKIGAPTGRLARLLKEVRDDRQLVEELYLSTVSRYPTAEETKKALDHVARASDRRAGFEDVLWSLINLREFVFNH